MKLFALFFTALLLGGSWANPVVEDQPKSKLDEVLTKFLGHLHRIETVADDATTQIKTSQLGRELDAFITETMTEVNTSIDAFRSKVAPYAQEAQERLLTELSGLAKKLQIDMEDIKGKVIQYANDARLMANHNLEVLQSQYNLLMRKMKKRVNKDSEELRRKLTEYTGQVQTSASEKVDAVRQSFDPYISSIRDKGQQRFQALQQAVEEQGKLVHEQFSSRAEELHGHLREQAEDMKRAAERAAERAVEALRQWIDPMLEHVNAQIQSVAEKFKVQS